MLYFTLKQKVWYFEQRKSIWNAFFNFCFALCPSHWRVPLSEYFRSQATKHFDFFQVHRQLKEKETEIFCWLNVVRHAHVFYLVGSLSYIYTISTKIPSTLFYSFYVVVFWEAPLYYTFCHHDSSYAEGGQNLPFKVKPTFYQFQPPQKSNNWAAGWVREIMGFQDKQMTGRQMTQLVRSNCCEFANCFICFISYYCSIKR